MDELWRVTQTVGAELSEAMQTLPSRAYAHSPTPLLPGSSTSMRLASVMFLGLCVGCSLDSRGSNPSPCPSDILVLNAYFPQGCFIPAPSLLPQTIGLQEVSEALKLPHLWGWGGRVPFILQGPQGKPTCPSQFWRNLREDE